MPRPSETSALRRLAALVLACLTVVLAGGTAVAQAAPEPGLQITPLRGPVTTAALVKELDVAKALGARFVRTEVRWDLLEPAPGARDAAYLARLDALVAAARQRGLRVVATFMGTPCWASTAPDTLTQGCSASASPRVASYPPQDPGAYAQAAAFVARRASPTIAWIEIWNEPDHANEFYWAGADKATSYAALLKAAYPAIKAAAPGVQVLGGAIVGANGAFLKALYAAGGKGQYDALSVHYYDLVLAALRSTRQTMIAEGDRKPVWLGEYGWPSCAPARRSQGGHICVTPAAQGRNIRDVLQAARRARYITGAVLYTVQDTERAKFGVLSMSGKRKPAFAVVRDAFRRAGNPARVTLRLRRSGGRLIASGTGPAGDALELDVFRGTRLRYRVTFRLDRDRRYRLVLPRVLGTRGLRVQVFQYWLGGGVQKRT